MRGRRGRARREDLQESLPLQPAEDAVLPADAGREKVFKTKDLSKQLGVARLSFADAADMERYLDITPGSVSVLGLMNDAENHVQLVIDKPIAESRMIGCHPCINSSTLAIATHDVLDKDPPRQSTMRRSWSTSRSRKKHKSKQPRMHCIRGCLLPWECKSGEGSHQPLQPLRRKN